MKEIIFGSISFILNLYGMLLLDADSLFFYLCDHKILEITQLETHSINL